VRSPRERRAPAAAVVRVQLRPAPARRVQHRVLERLLVVRGVDERAAYLEQPRRGVLDARDGRPRARDVPDPVRVGRERGVAELVRRRRRERVAREGSAQAPDRRAGGDADARGALAGDRGIGRRDEAQGEERGRVELERELLALTDGANCAADGVTVLGLAIPVEERK
jgi:hypothetical protein